MKKEKKDKEPSAWKHDFWNGIWELIFAFAALAVGLGVAILIPHEALRSIPAELFFLLGGMAVLALVGAVTLIVHLIKKKKENRDETKS